MSEWAYVGDVVVESGRLALVDPALADELLRLPDDRSDEIVVGAPGLIVTTGLGDGRYPVDVLYTDVEGIGRSMSRSQPRFRCQYALYVRKHPTTKPVVRNAYIPALSAGCCAFGANSRASPPSVAIQPRIVIRTGQRRVHRCSFCRIETPATNRNKPLR